MGGLISRHRWLLAGGVLALVTGYCVWLVVTDAPSYRFLVRLYVDKRNAAAQRVYERLGMTREHYDLFEWLK